VTFFFFKPKLAQKGGIFHDISLIQNSRRLLLQN